MIPSLFSNLWAKGVRRDSGRGLHCHEVARLHDNFNRGISRLQMYMLLKIAAWDAFPLSLAGIAHQDTDAAKAHCRKLSAQFDSMSLPCAEQTLHLVVLDALHPRREIRPLLDKWTAGDYDDDGQEMPMTLQLLFGKMFLWPVVERWLEQPHSVMKRLGSFRRVGGAFCSLSVRFPRILKSVSQGPTNLGALVSKFEKCRTPLQIVQQLGLSGHPSLSGHMQHVGGLPFDKRKSALRKAVGHAIYLTSADLQFRAKTAVAGRGFGEGVTCKRM